LFFIFSCVLAFFAFLVIVGTLYDMCTHCPSKKETDLPAKYAPSEKPEERYMELSTITNGKEGIFTENKNIIDRKSGV